MDNYAQSSPRATAVPVRRFAARDYNFTNRPDRVAKLIQAFSTGKSRISRQE